MASVLLAISADCGLYLTMTLRERVSLVTM